MITKMLLLGLNRIKFKPSLTKRRIDLLKYTDNMVKDIEAVKFAYTDMSCNLEMIFNLTDFLKVCTCV